MTEFDKLVQWLGWRDFNYKLTDAFDDIDGNQVIIYDEGGDILCDVVCHRYSYGNEYDLLEMMGRIVDTEDGVKGYLTAIDCADIIRGNYNWKSGDIHWDFKKSLYVNRD